MDKKMFCFQCEQTVGCAGCTGNAGVCGKKADTARLQDELTGALIGLAREMCIRDRCSNLWHVVSLSHNSPYYPYYCSSQCQKN